MDLFNVKAFEKFWLEICKDEVLIICCIAYFMVKMRCKLNARSDACENVLMIIKNNTNKKKLSNIKR